MTSPAADNAEYTRLHITPLDQSLLNIVIPSSVLPHTRNISYHTVETFPDKRYGFLDLPLVDAEKLKKKLNGAVLRGVKMRIEKARPESIPHPAGEEGGEDTTKVKKDKNKSKKRKREEGVISGIQLEDRKVKRGWTTTEQEMIEKKRGRTKKDKKAKEEKRDKKDRKDKTKKHRDTKSKYTDGPECLFKTKIPDTSPPKDNADDASGHKKKKRKSDREVVIHEFEKTVKHPSFLKSKVENTNRESVTYQDGVGWVDDKGTVVEPVATSRRVTRSTKSNTPTTSKSPPEPTPADDDDETSSSGSSSDEDDAATEDSDQEDQETDSSDNPPNQTGMTSPVQNLKVDTQAISSPASATRPKSSGSVTSLTIKIPPVTPAATKVHPLEALYKRPKGETDTRNGASQESKPFSFFNNDDNDDADDIEEEDDATVPASQPPMTPFTKQDFEYRNVRSAAPTPDTAHPSRSFNFWSRQETVDEEAEIEEDEEEGNYKEEAEEHDDDDDHDDHDGDEDVAMGNGARQETPTRDTKQAPVSDFQKQFWETRGELNRKWRKRRREASKEKRYRENRSRAARAI